MEKVWGGLTVFEIWLFCTAFNCRLELNDGKLVRATCVSRRNLHED